MDDYINLKSLTLDELIGVVNLYPWFSNAKKELCTRVGAMGEYPNAAAIAEAALYIPSRKIMADMIRGRGQGDYSDKNLDSLLRVYIAGDGTEKHEERGKERRVVVVGGDYFSQEEYDKIRQSEDDIFPKFRAETGVESVEAVSDEGDVPDFCTETLAQIYAEQGYPELAKKIYSKLILAYPEKNTYFAALIRELDARQ